MDDAGKDGAPLEELARAIVAARGERSPEEFAVLLGCSVVTVWRWENALSWPRSEAHNRILESEGVPRSLLRRLRAVAGQAATR